MTISALPKTEAPRSVTILGSTGSIGCNTVSLIEANPAAYSVQALTALKNVGLLAEQAKRMRPALAVVADDRQYAELKQALAGTGVRVAAGKEALKEAAALPSDWVMAGIVGAAGLAPTLEAVRRGAVVALANKECLVCAGDLMLREVARYGATLLPVDSEHNAIFQVFDFVRPERVEKVILTASGGPFREFEREAMADVTPAQAVAHPNWDMGAKISIDSATMMNKGLELIEAYHLFPIEAGQIEILVHPQSVVHSMVAYCDGSVLAQLGSPDMRTPISYSLAWPDRIEAPVPRLDLAEIGKLTFEKPDMERFPAIRLAREALSLGGAFATALNAANEIAVHGFLDGKIGFLDIVRIVEETLAHIEHGSINSLEHVSEIDLDARTIANSLIANTRHST